MKSLFLLLFLIAAAGCSSEVASNLNPATHCRVHGDSLVQGIVRADFMVGITNDSAYMQTARRLFPNTRNILFPNGGDKGMVFLHCTTCDKAWKSYRRE